MGRMAKNRFQCAMGTIFNGIDLKRDLLIAVCEAYATGDLDPSEEGGHMKVRWKQFAIDFDDFPMPLKAHSDFDEVLADPQMYRELQALRQCAQHRQLDLTDAFEEYAGTGRDANLGVMAKNRFRGAMGTMFQGINLSSHTLNKICAVYNYGDPDPKEPGTCMKVYWKQFAIDFDNVPLPAGPEAPDPTPEIWQAMQEMNVYLDRNGIDLEKDFEAYIGSKRSDIMPRPMFKKALGVVLGSAASLYQMSDRMLEDICHAYAAGEPLANRPMYREDVQWREFTRDVNSIAVQPYLEQMRDRNERSYPGDTRGVAGLTGLGGR